MVVRGPLGLFDFCKTLFSAKVRCLGNENILENPMGVSGDPFVGFNQGLRQDFSENNVGSQETPKTRPVSRFLWSLLSSTCGVFHSRQETV